MSIENRTKAIYPVTVNSSSMAKAVEKKQAIELRKSGLSYNEIREKVVVSKSTLSLWLRSVGLAKRQIRRLTEKQRRTQKIAVAKWHELRVEKTLRIKQAAQAEITALSEGERWLIGIALYWAEGAKEHDRSSRVQFSNSDPHMVILFKQWVLDFLKVKPEDITYTLYIHERSRNILDAVGFWSDFLKIEPHELSIVFKKHNPSPKRKNIGVNYRGLVRLTVRKSTDLNRKISGWIDGIIVNSRLIGE